MEFWSCVSSAAVMYDGLGSIGIACSRRCHGYVVVSWRADGVVISVVFILGMYSYAGF